VLRRLASVAVMLVSRFADRAMRYLSRSCGGNAELFLLARALCRKLWNIGFTMARIELQADHHKDDLLSKPTFGRAPRRSHSGMHQDFIVVALPTMDEAERIGACLLALARQTCRPLDGEIGGLKTTKTELT
jgi:hypothetical protein